LILERRSAPLNDGTLFIAWSRIQDFGFRVSGFGFRVSGFGFRVSGFGLRVSCFGSGFRVESYQISLVFGVSRLGCKLFKWIKVPGFRFCIHSKPPVPGSGFQVPDFGYVNLVETKAKMQAVGRLLRSVGFGQPKPARSTRNLDPVRTGSGFGYAHLSFMVEVMGRDAGYIAFSVGAASGAEYATIPEQKHIGKDRAGA